MKNIVFAELHIRNTLRSKRVLPRSFVFESIKDPWQLVIWITLKHCLRWKLFEAEPPFLWNPIFLFHLCCYGGIFWNSQLNVIGVYLGSVFNSFCTLIPNPQLHRLSKSLFSFSTSDQPLWFTKYPLNRCGHKMLVLFLPKSLCSPIGSHLLFLCYLVMFLIFTSKFKKSYFAAEFNELCSELPNSH